MKKFKLIKKMYNDGGKVGMGDVQQTEQDEALRNSGPQISELPDNERMVSPEEFARTPSMMNGGEKLNEDDFTKPGEQIPRNAGLTDFARYNIAHFDPTSEENLANIGMAGMGGISKVKSAFPVVEKALTKLVPSVEKSLVPSVTEGVKIRINPKIQQVAEDYVNSKGLSLNHGTNVDIDPKVGMKIAEAYEQMPHDPHNPEVKSAYDALKNETMDQYQAIKNSGLKAEPITSDMKNPYSNSQDVFNDIHNNNHLWYFPTQQGFGTLSRTADHPMLTPTNEKINGKSLLANDVFRIVHDYFGHAKEGYGFGPKGEENAWMLHKQMYSPEAQKAMTTETRGQNSWVNFGPHGIENQARPENTIYADQKAGILPDWVQQKENIKFSPQEKQNIQDALERLKGNNPLPDYSQGAEQALKNYNRPINSIPQNSQIPNAPGFMDAEDLEALFKEKFPTTIQSGSKIRFR